jgi:hypothetical protein
MNMNKALAQFAAPAVRLARAPDKRAGLPVAHRGQHRVNHEAHVETALGQFAHHRIDQERHVVVDDLQHRDGLQPAVGGRRFEANLGRAAPAHHQKPPGFARQRRKLVSVIDHEVLRRGSREQKLGEIVGNLGALAPQQVGCGAKPRAGRLSCVQVRMTGRGDVRHDRIAPAPPADCSGFAPQRKGCRLCPDLTSGSVPCRNNARNPTTSRTSGGPQPLRPSLFTAWRRPTTRR